LYRQLCHRGRVGFSPARIVVPLAANGAAMLANGRFGPRVPAPSLHGARKKNGLKRRTEATRRAQAPVRVVQQRRALSAPRARQVASARRLFANDDWERGPTGVHNAGKSEPAAMPLLPNPLQCL
jgi:hypothetical protein